MKPPIFSSFSSIVQTYLQTIEDRAKCKIAMAETTQQERRSSQQFSRYRNSPLRGRAFKFLPAQQRRSTVCPTELDRMNSPGLFSDSGSEEEKMLFEQSRRGRVSMIPGGKACRDLVRDRIHRFVFKVSDSIPFRDILWKSAAFSTHTVEEGRRFGFPEKERRSHEDRWGLRLISLDGHLLKAKSLTSVERIRGHLNWEEALAWDGFSLLQLQRVLIVAIAAAAAANFKRGVVIKPAERSLDDSDQSLNFMRRKLYNLSERISSFYDQSGLRNAGGCETCRQGFRDGLRNCKGKMGDAEKVPLDSTHAPCAVAILELKRRMGKMTKKEASNVMAAFASLLEKVEALEIYGSTQVGRHNKAQGVAHGDLKISVEKASAQITSLQMSLFDMWHVLLLESLCTINISPLELEHYLDKAKEENCMLIPSRKFNIQAWRQRLNVQEHASEATFLLVPRDETASVKMTSTEQEERRLSGLSDWSSSVTSSSDHNIWHPAEADVPSARGAAVKRSMDKISAPLDAENSRSNVDSHELVVEKSLGKLEIASEKVANNLELQLARLKEHLKLCEKKRKHSEEKLAEAVKKGIKNQLNFVAKEEEVACLRKECKQKAATIKEITLAVQKSKDTSDKRLAILEDICKKNNAMIMRLKDDMVALEEKVNACLGKESKQKDATTKEISLAQKLKVTSVKRLAVSEDICKKNNATITRLKDDLVSMEEKVSELKRFLRPLSSKFNGEYSLPLVMSYNPLFDNMVIPSSPDSPLKVFGLKTNEDRYLAANEYVSSSSQGYNETRQRSSGHSSASSSTYVKFRRNSTGTQGHKITKLGSSSQPKVKSFKSGKVLSEVDTNADLRSRRFSSDGEGLQQNTRNTQISKSKDITRKRWM